MGPFEVTKELVKRLDDTQLRALLDKLLTAEAVRHGISQAGISIGGNQTAGDGGVDGSITWSYAPKFTDWLPRKTIYFQCKAEGMAAAKLKDEMRPKDEPRSIFADLAKVRGAYIIFATDDPSKLAYENRITAMQEATGDVPNSNRIALDFYGADKIARWANSYPGVAVWLIGLFGRTLSGWRPYGDWSAPASSAQPYILDDKARAVVDGNEIDMRIALKKIREVLAQPRGVVRLIGRSGMGKTRLAEALFDDAVKDSTPLTQANAIYGDTTTDLGVSAARVTEEAVVSGVDAVIVVDNCSLTTHGQLAEIVGRQSSRASVLTIDYDMGLEKPAGLVVFLRENSEAVLETLLQQRCLHLSDIERQHLSRFSGGNARIALKIAEAAGKGVDLSTLNDGELLDRLFQHGRVELPANARACAEAAALTYAFYVETADECDAEHPVLAEIVGVNVDTFFRNIALFLDWGIVQKRGPQRAVMPPPLANMLAAPFIRQSDPVSLLSRIRSSSDRLLGSFARRLGQLHNEPAAVYLATILLGPDGPFGSLDGISEALRRAFVRLAPAAPRAAIEAIQRSLVGPSRAEFVAPGLPGRDGYLELLVHLAHERATFGAAMEALLLFVLADNDSEENEAARPYLLERFWPILSFTQANQEDRLEFIDRLLGDQSDEVRALGVEALGRMLASGHFSSSLNLEFGSKTRLGEWRPTNEAGYEAWYQSAYDRITPIAASASAEAEIARAIISSHFRDQVEIGHANLVLAAMKGGRPKYFWDDGWRAVCDGLHFGGGALSPDQRAEVHAFERELRPSSLGECFEAFVLSEPWRHYHPVKRENHLGIRSVGLLARAVGKCAARAGGELESLLRRATEAVGINSSQAFAIGLATRSEDLDALWKTAYDKYVEIKDGTRSPTLLFGILTGAAKRNPDWVDDRLDEAVNDQHLSRHLAFLHCAIPLDAAATKRFRTAIAKGSVPAGDFYWLQSGGVTKPIPANDFAELLVALYAADGGPAPALGLLHMRIFGDRSEGREVDPVLIDVGRLLLSDERSYSKDLARQDHGMATITKFVLDDSDSIPTAMAMCKQLRSEKDRLAAAGCDFDETCRVLMTKQPRVVLDEIVQREVRTKNAARFFGGYERDNDNIDQQKITFDETIILEWVAEEPAIRAAILASLVPYTVKDLDTEQIAWSHFAIELINATPEPIAVLNAFKSRFFSGVWSGSFSARLARRRSLISALFDHPNARIHVWARKEAAALESEIARWDQLDRDSESRFE